MARVAGFEIVVEAAQKLCFEAVLHGFVFGQQHHAVNLLQDVPGDAVVGIAVEDLMRHVAGLGPHFVGDCPVRERKAAGNVVRLKSGVLGKVGSEIGGGIRRTGGLRKQWHREQGRDDEKYFKDAAHGNSLASVTTNDEVPKEK